MEPPPLPPPIGTIPRRSSFTDNPIKKPVASVVGVSLTPAKIKATEKKKPVPPKQTPAEKLAELKRIVINIPENRDINVIHQEWQNRPPPPVPYFIPTIPPGLLQPIKKPDLGKIPVGTPHWQEELRKHLVDDEEDKVSSKIARSRPREIESTTPTTSQIEVTEADLQLSHHETDLGRMVISDSCKLPRLVQVTKKYSTPGCTVAPLDTYEWLLLHYPATVYRVHAVDQDGLELWLPIHAKQTYTRLPMDPRHDNKRYKGTTALANAKPLPNAVRVMEAHCADNPQDQAEKDDIVVISHVEMGEDRDGKPQKVVVAKIGDSQHVRLGEDMNFAEYSTMLSDEDLPMSELIKFDFPQRVRLVGTEDDEHKMLKLLSYDKEHHIICTRPNKKEVFSIPLTCPIKLKPVVGDWEICKQALPPLYPLMNHTWNIRDLGRRDLPDNFKQIVQPMPDVIKDWMVSYEGKSISCEVAEIHIKQLKEKIAELNQQNRFHMSRLSSQSKPKPSLPPSRPGTGPPPPARPPKSDAIKKLVKPTPAVRRTQSSASLPGKIPSMKRLLSDDYEDIDGTRDMLDELDEDDYEIPVIQESTTNNKLELVDDAAAARAVTELKKLLEKKEEDIRNFVIKTGHLEDKVKYLQKEKDQLETKNKENADQIRNQHIDMDAMLRKIDQTGDNVYDSIYPAPVVGAMGGNGPIYNSPADLRGVKVMTSENVCDMLREIHLGQYVEKFAQEQVDGALLEDLEDTIMKEDLGMTGLHARKLMVEIKKRKT